MDAIHGRHSKASNLANAVLDGKEWSSRGFRSSTSSRKVTASSCLNSSWIQRLIPPSQMARFEESHDVTGMCIDSNTITQTVNQCDTPVFENSRTSKLDFYSSAFAVVAADRYSAVLNAATSRSCEDTEVPSFLQREVRVAPKSLPTVESLLPSYSQKVDERPTLPEKRKLRTLLEGAGLSNEVRQIVHFSADKRPKVVCSSIKGLDFGSTKPAGVQSIRTGTEGFTMSERRDSFRCQDSYFSLEKGAKSCLLEHVKGVRARQSGFPASRSMKSSSVGSVSELWRIAQLAKELKECKQDVVDMSTLFETSPEPAQQSFYCKGNVVDFKSENKDFMSASLGQTDMGAGTDADARGKKEQEFDKILQGAHCVSKKESDNKVDCTKEMEINHLHALGRTSNWMGYKSRIRGTVAASEFSGSISLAGPSKRYSGGLEKANSSCLNSPEEIGDGMLSAWIEENWLPDGHLLPSVLGKRSRDHDRPIDVVPEEKSVVKPNLWMQRWFTVPQTQDLQAHLNVKREFKTPAGILPFISGDNARTGNTQLSPENFALVKHICHESSQYASKKKVASGFPSANQSGRCHASATSSHFMKRFVTPSVAAMAIMGSTARQVHGTQQQSKGLSDMWAAPKPSTSRIPIAQAETCKDLKTTLKCARESLPVASPRPLAPVNV